MIASSGGLLVFFWVMKDLRKWNVGSLNPDVAPLFAFASAQQFFLQSGAITPSPDPLYTRGLFGALRYDLLPLPESSANWFLLFRRISRWGLAIPSPIGCAPSTVT